MTATTLNKILAVVIVMMGLMSVMVMADKQCPESNGHKWVCSACYKGSCSVVGCGAFCTTAPTNLTSCLSTLPATATNWICVDTYECSVFGDVNCTFEDGLSGWDIFWITVGSIALFLISVSIIGTLVRRIIYLRRMRQYNAINSSHTVAIH